MTSCPFCELQTTSKNSRIVDQNDSALTLRDAYPLSPGHTLVIPKRHVASFFDLSEVEQHDLLRLVNTQHAALKTELEFQDCNVGINDGPLAGQTVAHCHIHLIPRYSGDVADPRGGIRWVIEDKADYWSVNRR